MTGGFLAFPYTIFLGSGLYYFTKNGKQAKRLAVIGYLGCIVLNPIVNRIILESKADEAKFNLGFIQEVYLIRGHSSGDIKYYEIKTQAEIDSINKVFSKYESTKGIDMVVDKIHTLP